MTDTGSSNTMSSKSATSVFIGIYMVLFSFLLGYVADVYFPSMMNVVFQDNDFGNNITIILFVYVPWFSLLIISLAKYNQKSWEILIKPQPFIDSLSIAKKIFLSVAVVVGVVIVSIGLIYGVIYFKREVYENSKYINKWVSYAFIMIMSYVVMFIYNRRKKIIPKNDNFQPPT